jgi:hypothetical protein
MTIIFDNTGFSVEYWGRFTESEFIEQGMKQKVFKRHPDDVRRQLLLEAFKIISNYTSSTTATT